MARTTHILAALAATVGAVFAFGPSDVRRELPEPEPVNASHAGGTLVVDLQDGASEADLEAVEAVLGADLDWVHELARDEALAEGTVPDLAAAIAALDGNPLVEVAEPELPMQAYGWPDDPMYDKQWNLRAMGAPDGWSTSPRGRGVVVAVIDTGVTVVEDLEGTKVLEGASFVPGVKSAADDQGHGTHVAGTIAQTTNNGKGVAGVAPEATILPVKVLDKYGRGSSPWIAAGIDYAVDNDADVINLSLGGMYSLVIHNAIRKARKKGVIVVAAAGNSGRKGVGYPGALKETIGVAAVGPDGTPSFYTSWGKGVDISAPGGDKKAGGEEGGILQNTVTNGGKGQTYAYFQGTSMATPHVVGAAAVLLSTGADADAVERILLESADGEGAWDPKLGHGRLNLGKALGTTQTTYGGLRFMLGIVMALLIGQVAGGRGRFLALSAATAGFVSGGLFFLSWLPLPGGALVELLSTGLLQWPAILIGPTWAHFPLWLSALLPAAVAFTLGAFKGSRPFAMGLAAGIGAALFHGAATGTMNPWWMPGGLDLLWLVGNASVCTLLAMALAGTEKLEREAA